MKELYAIKRNRQNNNGTITKLWWTNGAIGSWSAKTPKYYGTYNKAKSAIKNSYWLLECENELKIIKFELKEIGEVTE